MRIVWAATGLTRNSSSDWHWRCCKRGMHKSWLHFMAVNLLLVGILTRLRAAIENHIPLGYQDETGFHFGVQEPREN